MSRRQRCVEIGFWPPGSFSKTEHCRVYPLNIVHGAQRTSWMRVLIGGATGAIGRPWIGFLRERGHAVFALARSPGSTRMVAALGAEAVVADALDAVAVKAAATVEVCGAGCILRMRQRRPPRHWNARRVPTTSSTTILLRSSAGYRRSLTRLAHRRHRGSQNRRRSPHSAPTPSTTQRGCAAPRMGRRNANWASAHVGSSGSARPDWMARRLRKSAIAYPPPKLRSASPSWAMRL